MRARGESRLAGGAGAAFFGAVVTLSDLLPPRIRYGYVHRLTRRLFARPLAAVPPVVMTSSSPHPVPAVPQTVRCALLADSLEVGGIGSVVETLATVLPGGGVAVSVVCGGDGARAQRIRELGVEVRVASTQAEAARALNELAPDVIQVHGAPDVLERAALASGIALVPVLHNTEIHYSPARWQRFVTLLDAAAVAVAVSDTVRAYHARHVADALGARIHVVPNAIAASPSAPSRVEARAALARAIGVALADDVVFLCLARYDSQKNIAGLVASFLAGSADPHVRLVVAGDPSDWAELRRADALRRRSPGGERVTLLGPSDAATLLRAADAFVLDSFFEGWPVAATEAAAAGLPLVMSDAGGARELVARDRVRSELVVNAAGAAAEVSDAAVTRARRRAAHQPNAGALAAALGRVAERVRTGAPPPAPPPPGAATIYEMISGHVRLLHEAVALRDPARNGV